MATELAADLQFIRSEAVARNRSMRVSFFNLQNGASCYVIHTGSAASCHCEADGQGACTADASALKTVMLRAGDRASVQANVGAIVYDPMYGTSTPAATLRVTGNDGRAIHHVVNIMGRVRSCSPGGEFTGYRAC